MTAALLPANLTPETARSLKTQVVTELGRLRAEHRAGWSDRRAEVDDCLRLLLRIEVRLRFGT